MRNYSYIFFTILTLGSVTLEAGQGNSLLSETATSASSSSETIAENKHQLSLTYTHEEENSGAILSAGNLAPLMPLYSCEELLEILNHTTKDNIVDILTDHGPLASLFAIEVHMRAYPKRSKEVEAKMLRTAMFSLYFLLELTDQNQLTADNRLISNYIKNSEIFIANRFVKIFNTLSKADKKNKKFIEKLQKIKTVTKNDIAKKLPKNTKEIVQKIQVLLREKYELNADCNIFSEENYAITKGDFMDLATLFGDNCAFKVRFVEFFPKLKQPHNSAGTKLEVENELDLVVLSTFLRYYNTPEVVELYKKSHLLSREFKNLLLWTNYYADKPSTGKLTMSMSPQEATEYIKYGLAEKDETRIFQQDQTSQEFRLESLRQSAENGNSNDARAYFWKLEELGYEDSAVKWARETMLRKNPDIAHILLGYYHDARHEYRVALDHYDMVKDPMYHDNMFLCQIGVVLGNLGYLEEAQQKFAAAKSDFGKKSAEIEYFIAKYREDSAEKVDMLKRVLALEAVQKNEIFKIDMNMEIAETFFLLNDYPNALKYFNNCMPKVPSSKEEKARREELKLKIAKIHSSTGEYNKAISIFTELQNEGFESIGTRIAVMSNLSSIYTHQKQYEKALECCQDVITFSEEFGSFIAGFVYKKMEDYENAITCFQKAGNIPTAKQNLIHLLNITGQQKECEKQMDFMYPVIAVDADVDIEPRPLPKKDDNDEPLQDFKPVKDTKRYQRLLAEIEKEVNKSDESFPSISGQNKNKTYTDIDITLSDKSIQWDIQQKEKIIKRFLDDLANGRSAGRFETLADYQNRCSIRLTKADRLVFDIVEGSINDAQGIKAIVIVSAKGHYKNVTETEYDAPTDIKVEWIDDKESE